jgi:hypothetical protein
MQPIISRRIPTAFYNPQFKHRDAHELKEEAGDLLPRVERVKLKAGI